MASHITPKSLMLNCVGLFCVVNKYKLLYYNIAIYIYYYHTNFCIAHHTIIGDIIMYILHTLRLLLWPTVDWHIKDHNGKFHLLFSLGHVHYTAFPKTVRGGWTSWYWRNRF